MIEQKVEQKLVERFTELLSGFDIQIYGTLQPSIFVKGEQEQDRSGTLVVKVSPREYETPTVPTCQLSCAVALDLRADIDYSGRTYLEVCDIILGELEQLQKCLADVHQRYSVQGFTPTGFRLGVGDTTADQNKKVWTYAHGFTIYGLVQQS